MSHSSAFNPKKNREDRRERPSEVRRSPRGNIYMRSDNSIVFVSPYVNKRALRNKYRKVG